MYRCVNFNSSPPWHLYTCAPLMLEFTRTYKNSTAAHVSCLIMSCCSQLHEKETYRGKTREKYYQVYEYVLFAFF